jgi:ABC-type sugar transport system ATPase subunit
MSGLRSREPGVPVVLITHILPDAFAVADRLMVMHRGRKVAEKAAAAAKSEELVSGGVGNDWLCDAGDQRFAASGGFL